MEKKKALLREYTENAKEIARLEKELSFWGARSEHADVKELTEVLNNKLAEATKKALLIERAVAQIEDLKLQLLLTYHYLEGLTWEETADLMHIEIRWAFRLHNRALQALNI